MTVTALGDLAVFGVRTEEKGSLADIRTGIVLKTGAEQSEDSFYLIPSRMGLLAWPREDKAQGPFFEGVEALRMLFA